MFFISYCGIPLVNSHSSKFMVACGAPDDTLKYCLLGMLKIPFTVVAVASLEEFGLTGILFAGLYAYQQ